MRAPITDRNGRVLATSADADTVYAVPSAIDDDEGTARKLCAVLEFCRTSKEQLAALVDKLSKDKPFTYVRRHVSPEEAAAVVALKLDGVGPAQGEPPVLPDARADGRRSRLCRPRQQGPGRDRAEVQRHHPGQRRAGAGLHRRQAPRLRQHQRAADLRRVPRVDARRGVAARRGARAGARRRRAPRRQRRGHRHGPVDRRGAGHGQRPDLQPQRVSAKPSRTIVRTWASPTPTNPGRRSRRSRRRP